MANLISKCPVCGGGLGVPVLKCESCGLELKSNFELSPFDRLTEEQMDFLKLFLKKQGNLKAVEEHIGLSYPIVKKRLTELLNILGLQENAGGTRQEGLDMSDWEVDRESVRASDIVRAKLIDCGGRTSVQTLQGKTYSVWVESPSSFACDKIISYTYDIFDVIVEHIISQGGKSKKGNGRGHLGDEKCGEDTIAAAILKNYWKSETGFDPAFVMLAILEWAGIVHNRRGYAELTADYRVKRELAKKNNEAI